MAAVVSEGLQKPGKEEVLPDVVVEKDKNQCGNGIVKDDVSEMKKPCPGCALFPPLLKAGCCLVCVGPTQASTFNKF